MSAAFQEVDELFRRFPILVGGAATETEVQVAERQLGIIFPPEYREFLLRYGAGIVGPYPIYGVRSVEAMGDDWSVVEVNRRFRRERWPGVDGWLIVSMDHGGNPIGYSDEGRLYVSDHGLVSEVAKDLGAFLISSLELSRTS